MELPTGVLAFRVLKNGNISNKKQQLAPATLTSRTNENMKKQFKVKKQIFSIQDKKGHVGSERYPKDF